MMTPEDRAAMAIELTRRSRQLIDEAEVSPDPVEQRRTQAKAAQYLRKAADLLDDEGRLADG
jgi:hypothetical protein